MQQLKTPAEKEQELKRLREWLKKLIPEDYDKYDIAAKYDSSLSYVENKNQIREEVKVLINDLKGQAEAAMAQQERIDQEKKEEAEREVEEWNKSLSYEDCAELNKFYAPIHRAVDKISQGYSFLAFIKGRGGIGKSHNIRKRLVANKADYVEVCGEVTEAYLYRLIYENNGKVIWFKDVVKLLQGLGSINLLKSATETEETRVLTKSNYSRNQEDLPDKFACRCKFIFDYNNLFGIQLRDDFEALISRGDFIEVPICEEEIQQIMKVIARSPEEKEVTEFLIKNFQSNGMFRLNLRTQWKAFKTYEFANKNKLDWKQELKSEMTNTSKTRGMLYSLIGNKAVRTADLKKMLLKHEMVKTIRTADNKVREWLFTEELYQWSEEDRNFFVSVNPKPQKQLGE